MNPYLNYQHSRVASSARIDLLLALYDGAIERLAMALSLVRDGAGDRAAHHLGRAQLIVSELAAGVIPEVNPEVNIPILQLYEFVVHQLSLGTTDALAGALKVLSNLREGFQAIRTEALELERTGQVPSADAVAAVSSLA